MELVSSGNFLRLFPAPAFPCPDHSAEPGLHGLHPRGANRKKCLELGLVRKTQHMCMLELCSCKVPSSFPCPKWCHFSPLA